MSTPVLALAILSGLALVSLAVTSLALARSRREVRMLRGRLDRSHRSLTRQAAGLALRTVAGTAAAAVRMREQGVSGFLTSSIEELTGIAMADRSEIVKVAGPDGTVTVLFSDIEDSTALNEQLGDAAWMRLLSAHDALVRRHVGRHGGHIVKSQGDGFMVVFGDPADGIRAAMAIQEALAGRRRALRRTPVAVRMGLHTGPTIERDGDYFGRNVAYAARVAAQADGGEILVSDELRGPLADEFAFLEPRDVPLKGFPDTHRLWEVAWP